MNLIRAHKVFSRVAFLACAIALAACSSTGDKPKPTELKPLVNTLNVKQLWNTSLSAGTVDFELAVVGTELVAATKDGTVTRLDSATGKQTSSYRHDQKITAAVGADGDVAAFVDARNELVAVKRDGNLAWRQKLPTRVLTAPLVTKGSVFVLGSDQTVRAFDVSSGSSLWVSTRAVPALVLTRAGGLAATGETIFAALAQGRIAALSTTSGAVRWEQSVVSARGANEVEKLTDLIGKPALVEGDVCVRSFQAGVACVAQQSGRTKWTKPGFGNMPIALDASMVIVSDRDSVLTGLKRENGDSLWSVDRLKYRDLSGAATLGRSFVVGDSLGFVHWMNRESGAALARMPTDGTTVNTTPMLVGQTLVVRTQNSLYAFVAE
jgi:outer membrane protein assembly factor BamB